MGLTSKGLATIVDVGLDNVKGGGAGDECCGGGVIFIIDIIKVEAINGLAGWSIIPITIKIGS